MRFMILLLTAILPWVNSSAGELDPATAKALEQTQQLLKDRSSLEKLMSGNPAALQADQAATQLAGMGAHRDELYAIVAKIFEGAVTRSGGDPAQLQKLFEDAKKDPAKFLSTLSADEQLQIRELAKKIESSTAPGRSGKARPKP